MTDTRTAPPTAAAVQLRRGTPAPVAELGGKAASLDRLVQAGFPVPPTAVVTASAYRPCAAHPQLAGLLARLRTGAVVPAAEVDAAFLAVPVDASLEQLLIDAAREVGDGCPVAVRSSATVEDMAGASFAGQYRSSLDIPPDEVLHAVRLTWASLWHPAPVRLPAGLGHQQRGRRHARRDHAHGPRPVGRRRLHRRSGGAGDRARVEAVPELGEALVSGARTPDVWLLPRNGSPGDADVPAEVREAARSRPARGADAASGAPQDVEWAWDGARTWVVQARPITTGPTRTDDGSDTTTDDAELTTAGIGETLPGFLPPLVWELGSFLVEEALRIRPRPAVGPAGRSVRPARAGPPGATAGPRSTWTC